MQNAAQVCAQTYGSTNHTALFADSTFSSSGRGKGRPGWTTAVSVALQAALAAAVVALPLLRPQRLGTATAPPAAVRLNLARTPPTQPVPVHGHTASHSALSVPTRTETVTPSLTVRPFGAGRGLPLAEPGPPALVGMGIEMASGTGSSLSGLPAGLGNGPEIQVKPASHAPQRVSSGVMAGMLLAPMRPVYPAIARAAGVSGTVIVSATIDRTGAVRGLTVVSGPQMLRGAALDAIAQARYRPFYLNGEATEVTTTISVIFSIGQS